MLDGQSALHSIFEKRLANQSLKPTPGTHGAQSDVSSGAA